MINKALIRSSMGAIIAVSLYFTLSYILDKFINPSISTTISILITALLNFVLQTKAFNNKYTMNLILRYLIVEGLIIGANIYFFNKLDEYYNKKENDSKNKELYYTLWRMIIGILVFVFISFPGRKYIVYSKK